MNKTLMITVFLALVVCVACATPVYAQEATPVPATTDTNNLYTIVLILILILNLAVGMASRGWVLPATIGIISISIAAMALFTPVYDEIIYSPWIQLMLLVVAIMSMYGVVVRDNY